MKPCKPKCLPNRRIIAFTCACFLVFCVLLSCSKQSIAKGTREFQVPYRLVVDPLGEMCTDDTESRTEYFNVLVLYLERPCDGWLAGRTVCGRFRHSTKTSR
jgi:hypothetical protein